MKKPRKKTAKSRVELLQQAVEQLKQGANGPALLQAYENLRAMNSLQEIQRQISQLPMVEVVTNSRVY